MIGGVARKLFGSANDRRVRTYRARVDAINALEGDLEQLSDNTGAPATSADQMQQPK